MLVPGTPVLEDCYNQYDGVGEKNRSYWSTIVSPNISLLHYIIDIVKELSCYL